MKHWLIILLTMIFLNGLSLSLHAQDTITDDEWREDIQSLADGIIRVHPAPFRSISEEDFQANIDSLLNDIPDLSDEAIYVRVMRIVGSLQDGHSAAWAQIQQKFPIHYYPIRFYHFDDGIYLVDADAEYAEFIGSRLISVDGVEAETVFDTLFLSATGDNEWSKTLTTDIQFHIPEILQGAGIIKGDDPNYVLELPDGTVQTLNPTPVDRETFSANMNSAILPQTGNLRYLDNSDEAFWFDYLEDSRTFYFVYNIVRAKSASGLSMNAVKDEIEALIASESIDRVIIDLRRNGGGDEGTSRNLSNFLTKDPFFQEEGHLIILTGRMTFSAAVVFSLRVEADASVIFIGEPTGGRPLMFENNKPMSLSNSGISVRIASRARQDAPADDTRDAIHPHISVPILASDYFSGLDPAFETALAYVPSS